MSDLEGQNQASPAQSRASVSLTGLVLDQAFPRGRVPAPEAQSAPDLDSVVRYLAGTLTGAEAARIERGLAARPAARRLLREVGDALESIQSRDWQASAAEDRLTGDVRRLWQQLMAAQIQEAPRVREQWRAEGWQRVRMQAAAGAREAQTAWAAFLGAARQFERFRAVPALAAARGGGGSAEIAGLPAGINVILTAEVTADYALSAEAIFRDDAGLPSAALDGQTVLLSLTTGADAWPLASAAITDGRASWTLAGAGTDLNLPPGPLSSDALQISLTSQRFVTPLEEEPHFLLAAVEGRRSAEFVEVIGEVHLSDGTLQMKLALTPKVRQTYQDHILALTLAATPGAHQHLGAWPVRDWDTAPRLLVVPCPGDAAVLDLSWLDIQLLSSVPPPT